VREGKILKSHWRDWEIRYNVGLNLLKSWLKKVYGHIGTNISGLGRH